MINERNFVATGVMLKRKNYWYFPGGPVLRCYASSGRGTGLIPGWGTKGGASDKEPTCQFRRLKRCGFDP